jgi:hypothetical protein
MRIWRQARLEEECPRRQKVREERRLPGHLPFHDHGHFGRQVQSLGLQGKG